MSYSSKARPWPQGTKSRLYASCQGLLTCQIAIISGMMDSVQGEGRVFTSTLGWRKEKGILEVKRRMRIGTFVHLVRYIDYLYL